MVKWAWEGASATQDGNTQNLMTVAFFITTATITSTTSVPLFPGHERTNDDTITTGDGRWAI